MQDVAAKYPGVDLRVHASPADAPELAGRVNPRTAYEGLNDPNGANRSGGKGVQYGFTDNISTPARAQKVAIHEIVGHYGVDKILDPADWKGIQAHVMERGGDLRDGIASEYGKDPTRIAREYVARVAENTNLDPTLWQSIAAAVRKGLRAAGILRDWSDAEIQDLVRAAHRNLKEEGSGGRQGGELEAAASLAKPTGRAAAPDASATSRPYTPALRAPDGTIYTGETHPEAYTKALMEKGSTRGDRGYVTPEGDFTSNLLDVARREQQRWLPDG